MSVQSPRFAAHSICRLFEGATPAGFFALPLFRREGRVFLLMIFVALASISDLLMTLTYATSVGMMEMNPLARAFAQSGSPLGLIAWKLVTAGAGIGIFLWLRRSMFAELGSWAIALVMLALVIHWVQYNHGIQHETAALAVLEGNDSEFWIHFGQPMRLAER